MNGPAAASATPVPKVAAAGVSGAVATLAIFIATQLGVELGPTEAGAIATLVAFVGGYLKRS